MGEASAARQRGWWWRAGGVGGRTALWLAVVLVAMAAADRSRAVFDCSADRRFTLSDRLAVILRQQDQPVQLVGMWSADDRGRFETIGTHLGLMAATNPRITWRHLDPELDKPAIAQFASTYQPPTWPAVYVTRGVRAYRIPLGDWSRLVLQREIGGALVALADPHPPRAVLLQGHGELRPGGGDDDGVDVLAHTLQLGGFDVSLDDGSRRAPIPPEATVVIAGPKGAAIGQDVLDALAQHQRDGGAMLILGDDRTPKDLCIYLRLRGILMASGYPTAASALLDPGAPSMPSQVVYSLENFRKLQQSEFANHNLLIGGRMMEPSHPATSSIVAAGTVVISPRTTAVEAFTPDWLQRQDPETAERFAASGLAPAATTRLLATAPGDAWVQSFKPALEAPQGLAQADARTLAWAIEYAPDARSVRAGVGARVIVWGSRQAGSNAILSQVSLANADLLRSCADWLARRTPPADIPQADFTAYQVNAGDSAMTWLFGILVVVVPCLCMGAAMLTWWDRR